MVYIRIILIQIDFNKVAFLRISNVSLLIAAAEISFFQSMSDIDKRSSETQRADMQIDESAARMWRSHSLGDVSKFGLYRFLI